MSRPYSPLRICAAIAALCLLALATDALARQVHGTTRTSVGGGNANVNRNSNVNVNRNTNVNVDRHVDVDVDADRHWDNDYHPVARAAAVTTAVAVTAAAIGSIAYSIPPSCVPVNVNGMTYQQCGSTWYQPQYAGTSVQYVVVAAPR
jgi:hypothetical protein